MRGSSAVRNGFYFLNSFILFLSLCPYHITTRMYPIIITIYLYTYVCYCVRFLLSRYLRRWPHSDHLRRPSRVHNRIMHSDLSSSFLHLRPVTYARTSVITLLGYIKVHNCMQVFRPVMKPRIFTTWSNVSKNVPNQLLWYEYITT